MTMKIKVPISKKEVTPKVTVYHIDSNSRGDASNEIITLEGSKYYQFIYDDGTTWFSDLDTVTELFPNLKQETRDGIFAIPMYLESESEDRGFLGKIILKIIKAFVKPVAGAAVKSIALKLEANHLKEKSGLCQIDSKFNLINYTPQNNEGQPYLLFIHGTNSDTLGAFSGLKDTDIFSNMVSLYDTRILAFNHRTLTDSPLTNAVELAASLPDKAILHIISHSRGGLIGDILSKYASNNGNVNKGFLREQLEILKKDERTEDLKQIKKLDAILASKEITVEKFIRVASPSAGTILASERIDHIMNVLFNMIGDKVSVVAELTHQLIGAVLEQKSNIDVLPGIEAMNPASPFIKVLNARESKEENKPTENDNDKYAIDGKSLMVISGNGKLSLSFHGLVIILGRLFYQRRNDLVVNTDSMYLGIKRKTEIQYFFDEASYVDHIHYFKNRTTQDAVLNAIKTPVGNKIPGFNKVPQLKVPESDRGLDGGELFPAKGLPTGKKPVLIMLPGIMGSNIYDDERRIWLNYWRIISGGLKEMAQMTDKNEAKSIIKTSYNRLYQQLSNTYDVIVFPFDWRLSAEVNAARLNTKVEELLISTDKPIKVIGHSMGGVLFRDFIAYHNDTWEILNKRAGFKLVFLGSPLKGSHRILAVLFGKDSVINKLSTLDITHTTKELIHFFAQLPGILSLLPFTHGSNDDYSDEDLWKKMGIALGSTSWPIPQAEVLEEFKTYRNKINALIDTIDYSNMVYIAGQDKATACGHKIENGKLIFEYTKEGDHSVTWESGIPKKLLDEKRVYYTDITHGDLANAPKLFNGIEEILSLGSTLKISQQRPVFRDAEVRFQVQEHFDFDLSESGLVNTIMGTGTEKEVAPSRMPLNVTVSHGDLSYATFHVMAGHFKDDAILYAEKAIDYNLNGILQERMIYGSYPGENSTNELFSSTSPHFKGALIVGLGVPGKLTSFMLSKTVETGVLDFLFRIKNSKDCPSTIGISSLIIGCGYAGLSISNSTTAIIEGITSANTIMTRMHGNKACTISEVEFIEQDESSANNCLFTCRNLEMNSIVFLQNKSLKKLFGSRRKLHIDNTNYDWWNRITIKSSKKTDSDLTPQSLIFNASTGDAREEESELFSDTRLVNSFIQQISAQNMWKEEISKTLFELMIPNNFKDQLKRKGNIAWILDADSAAYPWELLQDNSVRSEPLCIGAGMVRQLITKNSRSSIKRVMNNNVLIIADPYLDNAADFNQLPGALKEGNDVNALIENRGFEITFLPQESASTITTNLLAGSFKIVHIAAHGNYDASDIKKTGIVIGNDSFITNSQINQMSNVPELVFVNCCHLGKIVGVDDRLYHDRYKLAANIGTQFIEIGVKAVIVAGWQVDDIDAEIFANTFYESMLRGENFGDSTRKARKAIFDSASNNTWGAYQCYGDPYYTLDSRQTKSSEKREYRIEEEACIDIENLYNSLDVRGTTIAWTLSQLEIITELRNKAGFKNPEFTEKAALIHYELGLYQKADELFRELKRNEDAKFSVNALEKFCNNKAHLHLENFLEKKNSTVAVTGLNEVLVYLHYLGEINKTSERLCLQGSTYKRIGFVTTVAADKTKAYEEAIKCYEEADLKNPKPYSFNNYVIFQIIIDMQKPVKNRKVATDKADWLNRVENNIKELKSSNINMDYWEKSNYSYSLLAKLFIDPKLSNTTKIWDELIEAYKETREKYGSIGKKKGELYNLYLIMDALKLNTGANKHKDALIKGVARLKRLLE
jgi:CHAT domain-containing protein